MSLYLRLLYRFYPPWRRFPEYHLASEVARKYGCRTVLDVGCGFGNLFKVLQDVVERYVGIDVEEMFAVDDPRATFVKVDAMSPPDWLLSQRFDCVFFVNSLFYISPRSPEALRTYGDLGRILVVVDVDPSPPHLHVYLFDLLEGGLRLTMGELVSEIERMGFRVGEKRKLAATYCLVVWKHEPK